MNRMTTMMLPTLLGALSTANAQSWSPPAEADRCPSKWGAGDQRGSASHMGPGSVLRATQLISSGQVIELGSSSTASICWRE